MASLGSFGEETTDPVEVDTITYFDTELRINPELTDADMFDFMEMAGDLDEQDPRAALALKNLMRQVFADDFDRFWSLAKQHRQSVDQRMTVVMKVIEAVSARPTGRSTDSAGGPKTTAATSMVDFAAAAQRKLEEAGRPDLAVAALRFKQAQAQAVSA